MIDVSDDMIDVSYVEEDVNEFVKKENTMTNTMIHEDNIIDNILTPLSPVRKRSKHCFCFYKEFEDDSYD